MGSLPHSTGDIIVVAVGFPVPLGLQKSNDMHLLVGGVWLIDSELEMREDNGRGSKFLSKDNPEFSRFMYGAACKEKTLEHVKIFILC